jgi:hypothetical protein
MGMAVYFATAATQEGSGGGEKVGHGVRTKSFSIQCSSSQHQVQIAGFSLLLLALGTVHLLHGGCVLDQITTLVTSGVRVCCKHWAYTVRPTRHQYVFLRIPVEKRKGGDTEEDLRLAMRVCLRTRIQPQ